MAKPRGAPPAALRHLDDCLLDAACCADSQAENTAQMLEAFGRVFADGQLDEEDLDDVLYLHRHTRLEHELNTDQESLMYWSRWAFERVEQLVAQLRARIQRREAAAR